jgi:hypothetical protein
MMTTYGIDMSIKMQKIDIFGIRVDAIDMLQTPA